MPQLLIGAPEGEALKLCYAAQVEPYRDRRELPPASYVLATVAADSDGVADFGARPSRIEFVAFRPDGTGIKALLSVTRGGTP